MIPSKTPEDNSSDPSSLGNAREPLLSDERLKARSQYRGPMTAAEVRDFYEALITSRELRYHKKPERESVISDIDGSDCIRCKACGFEVRRSAAHWGPLWCSCGFDIYS